MITWNKKVALIVDDNEVDRIVLKQILKKIGIKYIHEAEDGSLALFKRDNIIATDGQIDFIFIDVKMPRVDGKKLLMYLKTNPYTEKSKIIMVSGVNDKYEVEEIVASGANDYIIKPVDAEILRKKLEKLIE
ncbi:MAG: response regulator [Bdellovibrionota bacterium]